jgi:hypothetical protein
MEKAFAFFRACFSLRSRAIFFIRAREREAGKRRRSTLIFRQWSVIFMSSSPERPTSSSPVAAALGLTPARGENSKLGH